MATNGTTLEIGRQSEQELVGSTKNRKLKKILIWGFVAVVAIAIIIILSVFLTRDNKENQPVTPDKPALSLEDYLDNKFTSRGFSAEWVNDEEVMYRELSTGKLILRNVITDENTTLIDSTDEPLLDFVTSELSFDKKFLLVSKEYQKIYRHSFVAKYFIIDLTTKIQTQIVISDPTDIFLFAKWNPKNNGILLNFRYDLYYKKSPTEQPIRITTNGSPQLLNGVTDWVYEEEVFSSNVASWFSGDGNLVSFISFDDSAVRPFNLPIYGIPGDLNFQYTQIIGIPYPKVGTRNPTVKLFVVNLSDLEEGRPVDLSEINVPSELAAQDHIIATVAWANNVDLITVWMNRVQNFAIIQKCPAFGASCDQIAELKSAAGWVELFEQPKFNEEGTQLAIIASQPQGEAGAFRHITLIPTAGVQQPLALTTGEFVVTDLYKWEKDSNRIFYAANWPNSSQSKHIYSIKAQTGAIPQCITCSMDGSYWEAEFSSEGKNFILSNLGPNVPKVDVYSWEETADSLQSKFVRNWESNEELQSTTLAKSIPPVEYHEIDLGNGFTAKVKLQLPVPLDTSGSRKYPMLVDVYGGPDSFAVINKFDLNWGSYLASNKSYIYAKIDGRGSGLRGDKLLHEIYRKLGTVEIEDQITAARKLAEQLPYIDRNRIGIWGWSYGGYASGQALTQDVGPNYVFQCAASVAPVTDWLLYDSIYTERYMGLPTPEDNLKAYEDSRLDTKYEQFRNRQYLLIHGTRDDNVHFQQAMLLARTLERHDVMFKEVSYPDEEHGLVGVRPHLYHTLGNFFDSCFADAKAS